MEWFPQLELGWFNGWILLTLYGVVFGLTIALLPKEAVKRLYDRSGWSKQQRTLTLIGKLLSLAGFILVIWTPLRLGSMVYGLGIALFVLGLAGVVITLLNFAHTPAGEPVTKGLYKISRNPQWVMLVITFLGICIAVGSWTAVLLMVAATLFYHFRIRAEEAACLAQYGDSYRSYMNQVPRYFIFF